LLSNQDQQVPNKTEQQLLLPQSHENIGGPQSFH